MGFVGDVLDILFELCDEVDLRDGFLGVCSLDKSNQSFIFNRLCRVALLYHTLLDVIIELTEV